MITGGFTIRASNALARRRNGRGPQSRFACQIRSTGSLEAFCSQIILRINFHRKKNYLLQTQCTSKKFQCFNERFVCIFMKMSSSAATCRSTVDFPVNFNAFSWFFCTVSSLMPQNWISLFAFLCNVLKT